jgi:hypothetical protein
MVGNTMSRLPESWWPSRSLQRIVHIAVAVVLGIFIYSPLGSTARGELFLKLAVFPALVVSGLFMWNGHRLRPFLSTLRNGAHPVPQRLVGLLLIIVLFGVGHHIDHIIRGNHVGWPLTPEINAFTFSLLSYPFIALGLYLGWRDRAGIPYWTGLFFVSSLLIGFVHFGPSAIEPPADIITVYENALVGWFAFAWVVGFTIVLVVGLCYSVLLLVRQSNRSSNVGFQDE